MTSAPVASIASLPLPFASWQEGLFALADGLSDPAREKIIVARLEATAAKNPIGLKEICALALLIRSRARFDRETLPKHEPHPTAVALGQMLGKDEELNKHLKEMLEAQDRVERAREEMILAAFPEGDPRRLLNDTILGFSAALFADISRRLGEADPFLRLARRLSLWFKPFCDFSRYGLSLAADGSAVTHAVVRLVDSIPGDNTKRFQRLLAIWAGEESLNVDEESVREILSLLFQFPKPDTGGLDGILALEICSSLADELDSLDVGTIEALFEVVKSIHEHLDDGRPATAVFRTWLSTWSARGERCRLAYDPSQAFAAATFSDLNGEALEPLLATTFSDIAQGGHSIFATGPLPMRGVLFGREGPLFDALSKQAPEATDLYLLLSVNGDYSDTNGSLGEHWYWTGEGVDPNAVIFPDVIDRARERGDHALCDMLIGSWTLFCALFLRAPLPDLVGLAQRINALPPDYRSSTYAVLALLKREAAAIDQIRRDMDALLSWLPLIDTAPPEDFEAFMRDVFSLPLWSSLGEKERRRLVKSEEMFVALRRLAPPERQREWFRLLIVDWSAVTELVLRRAYNSVAAPLEADPHKPLGELAIEFRNRLRADRDTWAYMDRPIMYAALNRLDVLLLLNHINKRAGKHLSGDEIAWEDVLSVHAGLYWALRALLDVANNPPVAAIH
jgi:hypothetical protein